MGHAMASYILAAAIFNTGICITYGEMKNYGHNSIQENAFNSIQDNTTALTPPRASVFPKMPIGPPSFDYTKPTNVTALVGKSAFLVCGVYHAGNKSVSWIRHRDIHILTVGLYTYTSDQRFVSHKEMNTTSIFLDEWVLQIKWAQSRDAGIYECQISTQPVMSYFVNLHVVDGLVGDEPSSDTPYKKKCSCHPVPTASVLGGPDLYVDKGSTINLTCTIQFSPEPPAYIFWYHFDDVISYDSNRGGVTVITEKGDVTTSYLLIQNAVVKDTGKYSCSPSNADVASVRVHVLNGERPAAMQTGAAGLSNSPLNIIAPMIISYLYSTIYLNLQLDIKGTVIASR